MRTLISLLFCLNCLAINAQLPGSAQRQESAWSQADRFSRPNDSSNTNSKWLLDKYAGISSSFIFSNRGGGNLFAVPAGLQLSHRLNNNLYAFAGVSVAPVLYNFNHAFNAAPLNSLYSRSIFPGTNNYGIYSRAELGLMYINNDKTFSISGSIGVERNRFPVYPVNRTSNSKQ